jgi:DNA primase
MQKAKAVSILDVAHRLGLGPASGHGKEQRITCPFHADEHPSLSLNTEKNVWFCHPCGEGGDGLGLYMRVKEISFAAAVRELGAT